MPVHARPLSRAASSTLLGTILAAALAAPVAAQQPKWRPLHGGVNEEVEVATAYQGNLIVGGAFSAADGVTAPGIALWDGNNWQSIDDGVVAGAQSMHIHDGLLHVGGWYFTGDPNEPTKAGVLAWDGEDWTLLDDGTDFNRITALTTFNSELVIACVKQGSSSAPWTSMSLSCAGTARNGTCWATADSGAETSTRSPCTTAS